MRPIRRILFGVSLALCWSGVAIADPDDPTQSPNPSSFQAVTHLKLDTAFERFVLQGIRQPLFSLAGPSSMHCTKATMHGGIETCTVTTSRRSTSVPAALAQR